MSSTPCSDRLPRPDGCPAGCPGCRHIDWPAAASVAQKQDYLAQVLSPWSDRLRPLYEAPAEHRLGYRDKTTLGCEWRDDRWQAGLYRRDQLIPTPDCPVHSARVRDCTELLLSHLPGPPQMRLRYFVQSGAQVTLVLKQAQMPPLDWLSEQLTHRLAGLGVEALWLQLYPAAGYHTFTKRGWRLLWGQPRSTTRQGLQHGPESFQQLLPALHEAALDQAGRHLRPAPGATVLDLYCGIGAGLRRWRSAGADCLGVELNGEAVECAARNAPGAALLRGRCEHRLPQLETWRASLAGPVACYLNPPRSGLQAAVRDWLTTRLRAPRLAYLSCSAGTLARDLRDLTRHGYRVSRLQGFDFFPATHHVEVLALLNLPDYDQRGADTAHANA